MNRLCILVFAPDAIPEGITGALIGYSQAQALARPPNDVTLIRRECVSLAIPPHGIERQSRRRTSWWSMATPNPKHED